jgi:uncharacterized protein YoxC
MLSFVLRPLRSVLGAVEREVSTPLEDTEHEILGAVNAIRQTTASMERHVESIDSLANSMAPLTDSVNQLTATMAELVTLMAPMGAAEHGVKRAERFFGFRHHKDEEAPKDGHTKP